MVKLRYSLIVKLYAGNTVEFNLLLLVSVRLSRHAYMSNRNIEMSNLALFLDDLRSTLLTAYKRLLYSSISILAIYINLCLLENTCFKMCLPFCFVYYYTVGRPDV